MRALLFAVLLTACSRKVSPARLRRRRRPRAGRRSHEGQALADPEGYSLRIDAKGAVTIDATHRRRPLLRRSRRSSSSKATTRAPLEINDAPRYRWRGLHFDVARHFFPAPDVEHLLDLMARLKLNVFHWHLTDDQGWRLPVAKHPELTSHRPRVHARRDYPRRRVRARTPHHRRARDRSPRPHARPARRAPRALVPRQAARAAHHLGRLRRRALRRQPRHLRARRRRPRGDRRALPRPVPPPRRRRGPHHALGRVPEVPRAATCRTCRRTSSPRPPRRCARSASGRSAGTRCSSTRPPSDFVVMAWRSVDAANKAIAAEHDTVLVPYQLTYLDCPQSPYDDGSPSHRDHRRLRAAASRACSACRPPLWTEHVTTMQRAETAALPPPARRRRFRLEQPRGQEGQPARRTLEVRARAARRARRRHLRRPAHTASSRAAPSSTEARSCSALPRGRSRYQPGCTGPMLEYSLPVPDYPHHRDLRERLVARPPEPDRARSHRRRASAPRGRADARPARRSLRLLRGPLRRPARLRAARSSHAQRHQRHARARRRSPRDTTGRSPPTDSSSHRRRRSTASPSPPTTEPASSSTAPTSSRTTGCTLRARAAERSRSSRARTACASSTSSAAAATRSS